MRAILLALVALLVLQPAPLRERAQAIVDAALAGGGAPGISAAIALADGSVVAVTAGVSNRETKARLEPGDRMLIGSVGKTFAAARALQLVEQGTLGLDDPIARHLGARGWFDRLPNGATATVRHLLTHTSGLVRYEFKEAFARDLRAEPGRVWKPEDLLAYVFDEAPPFAPGGGWEYSDTNYIVLGLILEVIDGRPFYEQARAHVLSHLPGTRLVPSTSRTIEGLVQGYTGPGDPITGAEGPVLVEGRFVVNPQFEWTGGGYAGTPADLARWAKLFYEGGVFEKPGTRRLFTEAAVPARLGPQSRYGPGVIIRANAALGDVWGHSGFFPGYLTEMIYLPRHRIAVAVQVNTSHQRAIGRTPLRIALDLADGAITP